VAGIGSVRGAFEAGVCASAGASAGAHASATAAKGAVHRTRRPDAKNAGSGARAEHTSAAIGVTWIDVKSPLNFDCHFRTIHCRWTGFIVARKYLQRFGHYLVCSVENAESALL